MKKFIFLAALGAATLVSCDNRFDINRNETPETLGFSAYISRTAAKGSVTDVTAENLTSFKVAAYLNGTDVPYFTEEETATKNASGSWSTEHTYYWPASDKLDFYAYATTRTTALENVGGSVSLPYVASGTDDLLISSELNQSKSDQDKSTENGKTLQSLHFDHALTKINSIKVAAPDGLTKDEKYKYTVSELKVSLAATKATYSFIDGRWEIPSSPIPAVSSFAFAKESFLGNSENTSDDQLTLIPQTIKVAVTYSIKYSADGGSTFTNVVRIVTKEVSIALEKGKAYDITLLLPNDASPIGFSADVTGWESSVPSTDPTPVE